MKDFLDDDFLLTTPTARALYHEYAEALPIIDYHCHVEPREIYEDRRFENLAQLWLEGDHYKWRLMRQNGVDEALITGDADPWEKFRAFAETLPRAIGNPLYHWCHLELKTYFGYGGVLCGDTAREVWELCAERLRRPDMGVRGIIEKSGVAFIGTTDDPTDHLRWHERLAGDPSFSPTVAPSFRPDRALNIGRPGWRAYLDELGQAAGVEITGLDSLEAALLRRMEHFDAHGCRSADHGLDAVPFRPAGRGAVEGIFQTALRGERVGAAEAETFRTALLLFCGREYARLGWAMQLHFNCVRDPNSAMLSRLGCDAGFDGMGDARCAVALYGLLDALARENSLPRTILYSLNPADDPVLDVMPGAFPRAGAPGWVQHGSAWWFNDTRGSMTAHLTGLAERSLLGNFVGMLTDSRSFLSYARHGYFRRVLCALVGGWAERGEVPQDMELLGNLVEDICYHNAKRYFRI